MSDDTTVYRATGQAPYRATLHRDPDCYHLERAADTDEKPLSVFVDPDWCEECGPT